MLAGRWGQQTRTMESTGHYTEVDALKLAENPHYAIAPVLLKLKPFMEKKIKHSLTGKTSFSLPDVY